jgi:hypothetical protein
MEAGVPTLVERGLDLGTFQLGDVGSSRRGDHGYLSRFSALRKFRW